MGNRSARRGYRGHGRGNPTPDVNDTSLEHRIGERIQPQANGCWLFKGRTDRYGRTRTPGGWQQVHRYVYELLRGHIPRGRHLHHTCGKPGCCNPEHLVPLTPAEHSAAHRAGPL